MQATATEFDFIEEIRLRTWARENYVSEDTRDESWHPIILDEMRVKDGEADPAIRDEAVREEAVLV